VSAHDFFGTYSPRYLEDGREQYGRLSNVYAVLGHAENLSWRSTPLTHGLTYSLRLGIYNWFERWLMKSERVIAEEPPVAPEPDSTLWVGPTGNVTRDFASLRPFDLIRQRASSIQRDATRTDWIRALPVVFPSADVRLRTLATVPLNGAKVSAAEVNTEAEVWLPAWVFTPANLDVSRSALLVLDDRGRNAHAHEDDLYHRLARKGRLICAADVRGIGDTRPEVGRGNPDYTIPHDAEEEFAWASLILGNPLLAQRVADILALVQAVKNTYATGNAPLAVAARGHLSVPALFAFAATQEIGALYLAGSLASFQSVLETEIYQQSLANFAWDLFRLTDLPVLAAQSAPRPIHLAGSVNAGNNQISLTELRRIYPSGNVRFSANPAWDENTLSSV